MCHSRTSMLGWLFTWPHEGLLHGAAGGVGGVHDAPVAVAALAGEVQLVLVRRRRG